MGRTRRDQNSISLDKFLEGSRLDVKAAISAWVRARKHQVRVLNLDVAAQRIGCTRRTIEREIDADRGPAVVQITERKIGVLEEDLAAWIRSRRRVTPSTAAEAGKWHSPAPGKRRVAASKKANEQVAAE
jgi:predicted DNA-binding transcriptional regulator AlpA